jgi:O-glycosyl hydrolase
MKKGRDLEMKREMKMEEKVNTDLTVSDVVSWCWWLAVSEGDYKDGLIYVDPVTKTFQTAKMLWALGNFSKFVKQGYIRIGAQDGSALTAAGIQSSAYMSPDGKTTVVVAINPGLSDREIGIGGFSAGQTEIYVTDAQHDVSEPYGETDSFGGFNMPAQSVVTFIHNNQ